MLYGAVVLSPHARARVVRISLKRARAHAGVVALATAADVPGNRWAGLLHDDWPAFVAVGEEVRYAGDVVAAVDEATRAPRPQEGAAANAHAGRLDAPRHAARESAS
jgi:CO/xanthine dehydrogenase Mo-binding subunit